MPDWTTQSLWWMRPRENEPDQGLRQLWYNVGKDKADAPLRRQAIENEQSSLALRYLTEMNKIQHDTNVKEDIAVVQEWSKAFNQNPETPLPQFKTETGLKSALSIRDNYWSGKAQQSLAESRAYVNKRISGFKNWANGQRVKEMIDSGAPTSEVIDYADKLWKEEQTILKPEPTPNERLNLSLSQQRELSSIAGEIRSRQDRITQLEKSLGDAMSLDASMQMINERKGLPKTKSSTVDFYERRIQEEKTAIDKLQGKHDSIISEAEGGQRPAARSGFEEEQSPAEQPSLSADDFISNALK